MALQVDLTKSTAKLVLDLTKAAGGVAPPVAEVCFDLDVSGSYVSMHQSGVTNDLITRLIPWGMAFDPDKKLDVFTFSDGPAHYVGDINAGNYQNYVQKNIIGKVPNWRGGTDYAHVLHANLKHFGWEQEEAAPEKRGGWFGSSKPAAPAAPVEKRKSLILFNTDGANDDKDATRRLMHRMQDQKFQVYVQFIAVQQPGANFAFIKELADDLSNCGLEIIEDIHSWVNLSDDEINKRLITAELLAWMKA